MAVGIRWQAPEYESSAPIEPLAPADARRLGRVWEGWKRVLVRVGRVQAAILWTLIYLVLIAPIGLGLRLVAARRRPAGRWLPVDADTTSLARAREQF